MWNSELISPTNSPIFSLLSPYCLAKKVATDWGVSDKIFSLTRYWIPRVGFLEEEGKRERKEGGKGEREKESERDGGFATYIHCLLSE